MKDKYKIDQEEILWNNKDITIDGRPLYYETFDKIGIRYISDLIPAKETLSKKKKFLCWVGKGLPNNLSNLFKFKILNLIVLKKKKTLVGSMSKSIEKNSLLMKVNDVQYKDITIFKL